MAHRSVPCPATAVAAQTGAIFSILAAGAVNATMDGVAAARQAREDRNSHILLIRFMKLPWLRTIGPSWHVLKQSRSSALKVRITDWQKQQGKITNWLNAFPKRLPDCDGRS